MLPRQRTAATQERARRLRHVTRNTDRGGEERRGSFFHITSLSYKIVCKNIVTPPCSGGLNQGFVGSVECPTVLFTTPHTRLTDYVSLKSLVHYVSKLSKWSLANAKASVFLQPMARIGERPHSLAYVVCRSHHSYSKKHNKRYGNVPQMEGLTSFKTCTM